MTTFAAARSLVSVVLLALLLGVPVSLRAADAGVVRIGAGSYAAEAPPKTGGPPAVVYKTEAVRGAMPTNDWWRSLAWVPFSNTQFPHPLGALAAAGGLRVLAAAPRSFATGTRNAPPAR